MPLCRSSEQLVWFGSCIDLSAVAEQLASLAIVGTGQAVLGAHQLGSDIALEAQCQSGEQCLLCPTGPSEGFPCDLDEQHDAGSLFLRAAFCASCPTWRFVLGPQSYWKAKRVRSVKKGEEEKSCHRVQVFCRQKCRFSTAQWQPLHEHFMFVHYSVVAGQSSPEQYHFLPAHLLQNSCFDPFKIKLSFPIGQKIFLAYSIRTHKKPLLFYVCGNSPQSRNLCFLLVLWVWSSHAMPTVLFSHLW